MTAGVVAVVQVDAGEPAAQGEAEAVPGRGLLRCRQGGKRWKIWKAGIRQENEQEEASTIVRAIRRLSRCSWGIPPFSGRMEPVFAIARIACCGLSCCFGFMKDVQQLLQVVHAVVAAGDDVAVVGLVVVASFRVVFGLALPSALA